MRLDYGSPLFELDLQQNVCEKNFNITNGYVNEQYNSVCHFLLVKYSILAVAFKSSKKIMTFQAEL